ncbi:hypothetical protein V5O48_011744 [Marasmius crinis-equi]|uniref:IRG-type G domain-containing protein n=1 Tax=Marasmius crinis-equi TaxID=585013 RepID=A0ABR3F509_9AGAR
MDQMECHYQMQAQAEKERAEAQERADAAAKAARDAQQQATAVAAARDAEAARVKEAEARSRRAQQAADKAQAAKTWGGGEEEFNAVKQRYSYKPGKFHLAVAGIAGTGKSSLINALWGLGDKDPMAARTGVKSKRTLTDPDPDDSLPFVWFDVPGTGTLSVPDWTYFNNLGLYIFDAMIILFDNRFTDTDVAIIQNCVRFRIPFYIVRSKSDQHIQNLAKADMEDDSDDDSLTSQPSQADIARAKPRYEAETRKNVRQNLLKAGLPEKSGLSSTNRSGEADA